MGAPTPLDWRVEIAPDAAPDGDPAFWSWVDVGAYRRQSSDIELNTGRDDEASEVEASDSSLTLDLRDGALSPRNPYSVYYGRIGTNTPIRYRLPNVFADTFDRTVAAGSWGPEWSGSSTSYSVSSSVGKVALAAANTATATFMNNHAGFNVDMRYTISISAVTTGDVWVAAAYIRYVDTNNWYRLHAEFRPGGTVSVKISKKVNGVLTDLAENQATGVTYTANQKIWVRVQALGPHLRVKAWNGALSAEPTFFQLNMTDGNVRGGTVGFYNWRLAGNTNVGTLTVSYDDLRLDAFLWAGNVPEFPVRWDKSGNDSTAPLGAAGPLRRLGQGDAPVKSALTGQLPRYAPAGYWPFEDAAGATSAASALTNGNPAVITGGISFGNAEDGLPGTISMAKFDSTLGATVTGTVSGSTGVGFAGLIFYKFDTVPSVDTVIVEWRSRGSISRWRVVANGTGMYLQGYGTDGTMVFSSDATAIYPVSPLIPFSVQLETSASGSNTDYSLLFNSVGDENFYIMDSGSASGLVPGAVGSGKGFYIPGSAGLAGAEFGQIWMGSNSLPYVDSTFLKVAGGYAGELATDRLTRLFAERGIALALGPGAGESMGVQRPGKFLDQIRECAKTDGGILYESGTTLGYLPRESRYNLPVALTLDWAAGDLAEAPEPTDDDQRLRNQVTVTRVGGSSATAQDNASIARFGAVPDTLDVNVETDARVPRRAEWEVSLGSIDELRWPSVKLDLIAHPEFIPAVLTMQIGSRIQIVNPKSQIAGTVIDLIVEGLKYVVGRYKFEVEVVCSSATAWLAGIYDDAGYRYDSAGSTLNAAVTKTATTLVIKLATPSDAWSRLAADLPYDIVTSGEQITFPVGGVGAVTGSPGSYTQTITGVTRAVNGISKALPAGARVNVVNPGRYAL